MSNNNFPIDSLDQPTIATNLQNWMTGNPYWKDYNFAGSGISSLINFLSYNTSYIGFYVKMLLAESFVDSAQTVQALWAAAKRQGYTPRSVTSASAEVTIVVTIPLANDPANQTILIPAGSTVISNNSTQDQRVFNVLDDIIISNRVVNGNTVTYTSNPTFIYEGSPQSYKFTVNNTLNNQTFVLPDVNVDASTIRVRVSNGADSTLFVPVDDLFNVGPESQVFYTTTATQGYYQVFFGNNTFGVQPQNQDTVTVTWVSSNGVTGNGASVFLFNATPLSTVYIGATYAVTSPDLSSGGALAESVSELQFNIPNAYRRQNRLVTTSDYQSVILEKYPNIDSLSVWGGEDNIIKTYGSIFVSIKPKYSNALTASLKAQIQALILKPYGIVGMNVNWVDPNFINVDISVRGTVDLRLTSDGLTTIQSRIISDLATYNTDTLNHYGTVLSDLELLNFLKADEPEITTLYSTKILWMTVQLLYQSSGTNQVLFSNPLVPYSILSSNLSYGGYTAVTLSDDGLGGLWLMNSGSKLLATPSGSVDYASGVVSFTLPQFATVTGYIGNTGQLIINAEPAIPDIETSQNNIVRIASTSCILKALTQ
jgi:hypothetical protein